MAAVTPTFCGIAVVGDRGGQAEACGKLLPCADHPHALDTARRAEAYASVSKAAREAIGALRSTGWPVAKDIAWDLELKLSEIEVEMLK